VTCYVVYAEAEDVDEFEKWQKEIKEAEAQVEASEFSGGGVGEDVERPSTPPDGEEEFTDDDGTYKWDKSLRAYKRVPQVGTWALHHYYVHLCNKRCSLLYYE